MNNNINSLKDALMIGIGITENEELSQEDRNSALDELQADYENFLEDSLMLFKPGTYSLLAFSPDERNFIESIKLIRPSAEAMEKYLRTFAESDNAAMLIALAHVANGLGYTVAGIDRRSNSEKLADFAVIIEKLKTGETDDALALLEQVTDVNNITVTVE